jgi:hypothetical protein
VKNDPRIGLPAEPLMAFVLREVTQRDERIVSLVKAVSGFVWLGNNLHNIEADPVMFRQLYEAALVDARQALAEPETTDA